jgi:hypothetical protein
MADQAPAPAADAAADVSPDEALKALEAGLSQVAESDLPPEAKQAFAAALDAFRQGVQVLTGGAAPAAEEASGPVGMEQGASGARPMSHGGPR